MTGEEIRTKQTGMAPDLVEETANKIKDQQQTIKDQEQIICNKGMREKKSLHRTDINIGA